MSVLDELSVRIIIQLKFSELKCLLLSKFCENCFLQIAAFFISCCFFSRFYSTQKKTLEINPRHPLIKELKSKVEVSRHEIRNTTHIDLP